MIPMENVSAMSLDPDLNILTGGFNPAFEPKPCCQITFFRALHF